VEIRDQIDLTFVAVYEDQVGKAAPAMLPDTKLLETDLDSMGFAILVMELEDALGFDPFVESDDAYYPSTYGEFVEFYVTNAPGSQ
jgi:acyl carrier protein